MFDDRLAELAVRLLELGRDVAVIAAEPVGQAMDMVSINADLKNLRRSLLDAVPFKICPLRDQHKTGGCKLCKMRGWVTKLEYNALPETMR